MNTPRTATTDFQGAREMGDSKIRKTMAHLSYGLSCPADLLEKLKSDGEKLNESYHPNDVFNFIITAAVLAEWIQKYYVKVSSFRTPEKDRPYWRLPENCSDWIKDASCLPSPHQEFKRHISNALSICSHAANASKHFHWNDGKAIKEIGPNPPITDWYQYFFTSCAPDIYLDFYGEHYGLQQIKGILIQFFDGLIASLEGSRR